MTNKECIFYEKSEISTLCPYYDSDYEFNKLVCMREGDCKLFTVPADISKDKFDKIIEELARISRI